MTPDEMKQFQKQRCARWGRVQAELSTWKPGGPTWKPSLTERQKRELDEYIRLHNCPF
jgi:hypothetical protein